MKIWYRFLNGEPQAPILEALGRARLFPESHELSSPQGPGIVFFEDITPQLLELLSHTSRRGMERVLAVGLSKTVLKSASVWSLLRAGASDVFVWDNSRDIALEVVARFERWEKVDEIVRSPLVKENLAGQSAAWIRALRQLVEIAHFTESTVLITGESGHAYQCSE